ncbi:MAG: NADH-quinone oxidoreductase subunit L [Candidatus Omnitrophota bacterium]
MNKLLFLPILIPLAAALGTFFVPHRLRKVRECITLSATAANFLLTLFLFKNDCVYILPWLGPSFEFSLRLYRFSAFIMLAVNGFGFLISLYSVFFMSAKAHLRQFYSYFLITIAFACGAVLSDNLFLMLFFWEGLLLVLFGMIAIGSNHAFKAATKAFIITGIADLCMMIGIALCGYLAGTLTMSKINLPLQGMSVVAFILLMIGAISKAGSMPFHSWIPDAAIASDVPFMALVPAVLEKLLGIYFLTRISLDLFQLNPASWLSVLLMIIGSGTILLAVMMALIQKNYKRLLSYHAISQVGYMILGIGTALPIGIVGGLFHMINNAIYKSALFLTAGSVEKQTGTADLEVLGGLMKKMPVTFVCFAVTAVSISGVPPFNGFFSKELIYEAALSRGLIFYLAAIIGSFFTAASFLKLGHAVFFGGVSEKNKSAQEASWGMLVPMIVLSLFCILFGLFNSVPLAKLIAPVLGQERLHGHSFTVFPLNLKLTIATVIVLVLAFLNHIFGVKMSGSGLHAADHIRRAPLLRGVYDRAERRFFDPYDVGRIFLKRMCAIAFWVDRKIDWLYEGVVAKFIVWLAGVIKRRHTENYSVYLGWALAGLSLVVVFLFYSIKGR